jgi:hypothetical protein
VGACRQLADDFLVSAMDTIKYADGQPGTGKMNGFQGAVILRHGLSVVGC